MCVLNTIIYIYMYVYIVPPTKKKLFSLSSSGGYHKYTVYTVYIYMHICVCINCCLTLEPRYLEQFCQQKRLQTFANESRGPSDWLRIQDSRFKIQKKLLESRNSPDPSPGIQEVFFGS